MAKTFAVNIEGLAELRRDLRATDREANKEVQQALKRGAEIVSRQAALLAPRETGRLAGSYRPFARGTVAGVRSALPYAGVHEYGGTIRPRGTPIEIRRSEPITRSVERQTDAIVQEIAEGIDDAAHRTGWR